MQLTTELKRARKELAALGENLDNNPLLWGSAVLAAITDFCKRFSNHLTGRHLDAVSATAKLSEGARIHIVFDQMFYDTVDAIDPSEHVDKAMIRTVIRNGMCVDGVGVALRERARMLWCTGALAQYLTTHRTHYLTALTALTHSPLTSLTLCHQ